MEVYSDKSVRHVVFEKRLSGYIYKDTLDKNSRNMGLKSITSQ